VLSNGLALKGIQSDLVQIIKGLVLLIAVGVDVFNKSQGRPSIIGLMTRNKSGQGPIEDLTSAQVTPGGGTPDTAVPADLPR